MTKAMKARYRIGITGRGNWQAQCPRCDEYFWANDPAVSQAGVVAAVQRHEAEVHPS